MKETFDLVAAIQKLQKDRAYHLSIVEQIDKQLAQARVALSSDKEEDLTADVLTFSEQPKICQVCGESFVPSPGSSGRYCSQKCYAGGMTVEQRRDLIVKALAVGPMFPTQINQAIPAISRSTITNDLYALSKEGRVHNTQEGWRITESISVNTEPEPEDEPVPLAARSRAVMPFPTSRLSSAS